MVSHRTSRELNPEDFLETPAEEETEERDPIIDIFRKVDAVQNGASEDGDESAAPRAATITVPAEEEQWDGTESESGTETTEGSSGGIGDRGHRTWPRGCRDNGGSGRPCPHVLAGDRSSPAADVCRRAQAGPPTGGGKHLLGVKAELTRNLRMTPRPGRSPGNCWTAFPGRNH